MDFIVRNIDEQKARAMLADLEMFKIIDKLNFSAPTVTEKKAEKTKPLLWWRVF